MNKYLIWAGAAIATMVCLTACEDSSSGSSENSVPEYKSEASLPDSCEMEVAKVANTYFACFENKWVEVTDSATVEQFKEGLDEEEIQARLKELEDLLKPAAPAKPASSASKTEEVESSDSAEPESSSSEVCTGRRCKTEDSSSSKKESGNNSDSGEGGSSDSEGSSSVGSSSDNSSVSEESSSSVEESSSSSEPKVRHEDFAFMDDYVTWTSDTTATVNSGMLDDLKEQFSSSSYSETKLTTRQEIDMAKKAAKEMFGYFGSISGSDVIFTKIDRSNAIYYYVIVHMDNKLSLVRAVFETCGTTKFNPRIKFCDTRSPATLYKFVTIGSQIWMAENLNYATESGSYCYDQDNQGTANCDTYGRLYTWAAAMGKSEDECGFGSICSSALPTQGVCPTDWHLPSYSEWEALIMEVDGTITEFTIPNTAGTKLKSTTGWKVNDSENTYSFTVIPAGHRNDDGSYTNSEDSALFWSSSERDDEWAYNILFLDNDESAYLGVLPKSLGYSVRCIKN